MIPDKARHEVTAGQAVRPAALPPSAPPASVRRAAPAAVFLPWAAALGLTLLASTAAAQQPGPPPACQDPIHRAFDYWAGEWLVRNTDGDEIGRNRITVISGGCGLLEEWTSGTGSTGKSLNFHDPARDAWRQVWVGQGGQVLDLAGGPVDGVMTLEGVSPGPDGPLNNRIRWIPREGGAVEQLWEQSSDGETWQTVFRGIYEPVGGAGG